MNIADVIDLYTKLNNLDIELWLDGGWGVDALLGEQTRLHSDVDIVIQHKDVPKLRELLESQGYKDVPRDDTSDWNFVLGDNEGRLVDVHVVTLDAGGNGFYGPPEKGVMYPAGSLTGIGVLDGHTVKCVSAEYMVKFHTGGLDQSGLIPPAQEAEDKKSGGSQLTDPADPGGASIGRAL